MKKQKLKARNFAKRRSAVTRTAKKTHTGRTPHRAEHGQTPEDEHEEFKRLLVSAHPEDAVPLARSFVRRWPKSEVAWCCLGAAEFTRGDYVAAAVRCFRKAVTMNPGSIGGWTGIIECLLADPRTRAEGFATMRKMHDSPAVQKTLHYPGEQNGLTRESVMSRFWDGERTNKPVYLWMDGGHGDSFLQIRFASLLKERCRRVIVSGAEDDMAILQSAPGVDCVMHEHEWATHPDMQDCLWISGRMALAQFYADTPTEPYLTADAKPIAAWAKRLAGQRLKVGLVWKGGTVTSFGQRRDADLEAFAPLGQVDGIDFYSLQKGPAENDACPFTLHRLAPDLHTWSDTAAVLSNLDLLLSVDTGCLHLSAAMGVETWGLITTQFWSFVYQEGAFYPSLQIFRKRYSEPWAPTMEKVAAALARLAKKHADDRLAFEIV